MNEYRIYLIPTTTQKDVFISYLRSDDEHVDDAAAATQRLQEREGPEKENPEGGNPSRDF
jgi:hypothetical protein